MDGYLYDVVLIGDKCWFSENLRTTQALPVAVDSGNVDDAMVGARVTGVSACMEKTSRCANLSPDFDAYGEEASRLTSVVQLYAVWTTAGFALREWRT